MKAVNVFKFVGIREYQNEIPCPHCHLISGRYLYAWEQDGERKYAIEECYNQLTSTIDKPKIEQFYETLNFKLIRLMPLDKDERRVVGLNNYIRRTGNPRQVVWAKKKIKEIVKNH